MPDQIPFDPGIPSQSVRTTLDNKQIVFNARWNARDKIIVDDVVLSDGAWYLDLYDGDGNVIIKGIKIVLGVNLGRTSNHEFFQLNILRAFDTTNQNREAQLEDLGTRVIVLRYSFDELFGEGLA